MEEKRSIVHLDLDTFFVSVERLVDNRLNGKPVLIGGSSDRGVVASCSYEARRFGVHSAMPMRTARQLCPEAIVVRGDFEKYSQKSQEITEIIREGVPLFEKASIDEFYIDLSGMDRFFGCFKLAHELRQRIIQEIRGFMVPVPEPGTLAIAGLAAAGLAVGAWRRRGAASRS